MLRDHAVFVRTPGVGTTSSGVSLQTRLSELEGEVGRLREQLGKAKGINDTMWETVVQRLVARAKEKGQSQAADGEAMEVDGDDDLPQAKRGRT